MTRHWDGALDVCSSSSAITSCGPPSATVVNDSRSASTRQRHDEHRQHIRVHSHLQRLQHSRRHRVCGVSDSKVAREEKALLAHRVKQIQRRSEGHMWAWWDRCGQQGTSTFDPNRHGVHALQRFPNAFDAGAINGDGSAVTDKGQRQEMETCERGDEQLEQGFGLARLGAPLVDKQHGVVHDLTCSPLYSPCTEAPASGETLHQLCSFSVGTRGLPLSLVAFL